MELRRKQKQPIIIEIRISVTFGLLYMLTRARESLLECWKCWFHGYVYVYLLRVYGMPICFIYVICWVAAAAAKSLQLCLTLCDPIDGSPQGSPIPGILQASVLEWGCHFLLQCMKVKSESEATQSCPTLSDPMDCSLPGSLFIGFSWQAYWSGLPLPSPNMSSTWI